MKVIQTIIIHGLLTSLLLAATVERPSTYYKSQAKINYGWLKKYRNCTLYISTNKETEKFILKDEISRYFKLKLRNLVNDIKIVDNPKGFEHNYCTITVELYKYNDKMQIYTGLIELSIVPSIIAKSKQDYRITYPIAGANTQIKQFIKSDIDSIVEKFATDYYYIKDMK